MKKVLFPIGILAISALAFSSCEKETATKDEPVKNLVTISFSAEKAGTKTAAVEGTEDVSFIWTDEDIANIKLFPVTDGKAGDPVAAPKITKESDTKLVISTDVEPNATYTFRAVLAGNWTAGNKPRISNEQSPKADNFDPNADVLISDDLTVEVGADKTTTGDMLMTFNRQIVNNKMTLKNLTEGEKIDKVIITSTSNLSGYFDLDTQKSTGEKKVLTISYNKAYAVDDTKTFPVYFTTLAGAGQSLTVEVTTDQFIYTKSFAEGKSIDFNLGEFTKFNLALPAGTPNGVLSLPFNDDFSWVSSDATLPADKYSESSKIFTDKGKIRLGTGSDTGFITTKEIDLSSAFYVKVNAFAYNATNDNAKIQVKVDDGTAQDAVNDDAVMTATAKDYYFNFDAATSSSKVTITVSGSNPRFALNSIDIFSGTYKLPPVIKVTSSNPLEVENTASSQTITYEIDNATEGTLTASSEASWISNINYATSGKVTFDVAAQEAGANAREGIITLVYDGAESKDVTVKQAAGAGGASTYTYVFTAKDWTATLNESAANWASGKVGGGFTSGQGLQVTESSSGANGTSPSSFTDVEEIVVTYCTNASKGAGTINVSIGDGTAKSFSVTKPSSGGTTLKTATFTYSTKESGKVKLTVNCTTNSVYIYSIAIKAASIGDGSTPGGGESGGTGDKTGSFTLDSDAIKSAHSSAWTYTSGTKSITATDGSVWTAVNTFALANQVTLQLNSGKSGYIATPIVSGKITKITVELTSAAAGTGTGTRAMNVQDGEGNTIASSVAASDLIAGYSITGTYSQLRLDPTGATYVKSIKIDYE